MSRKHCIGQLVIWRPKPKKGYANSPHLLLSPASPIPLPTRSHHHSRGLPSDLPPGLPVHAPLTRLSSSLLKIRPSCLALIIFITAIKSGSSCKRLISLVFLILHWQDEIFAFFKHYQEMVHYVWIIRSCICINNNLMHCVQVKVTPFIPLNRLRVTIQVRSCYITLGVQYKSMVMWLALRPDRL